jgi:hypothetical protein
MQQLEDVIFSKPRRFLYGEAFNETIKNISYSN